MIDNMTLGIDTTYARTRITTFIIDAGTILSTVRVKNTFWTTLRVRIAIVFRQTGARPYAIAFFANCIGTTRAGIAGFSLFRRHNN